MTDDDLIAKYAAEAKKSIEEEAQKRVDEVIDPIYEAKLRSSSLFVMLESEDLVPALLARLGSVRAALDGHGGGIKVDSYQSLFCNILLVYFYYFLENLDRYLFMIFPGFGIFFSKMANFV